MGIHKPVATSIGEMADVAAVECNFCKKNGVSDTNHETVKDGVVVCPGLYQVICGCCGSTGEKAHTTRHCPHLKCRGCGGRHLDQYCKRRGAKSVRVDDIVVKRVVKPMPPKSYTCKACGIPGHWILNCEVVKAAKKTKEYPPPPDGYVCKACNEPGHWIQQCTKDGDAPLPEGYVCKACNEPGHWIKQCKLFQKSVA
jgi:hypothetical protein